MAMSLDQEHGDRYSLMTGVGGTPGEGPYISLTLEVVTETGFIMFARATANGCPTSIKMGLLLEAVLPGRTTSQVLNLDAGDLTRLMGGVPEGKEYVPELAVAAITSALNFVTTRVQMRNII